MRLGGGVALPLRNLAQQAIRTTRARRALHSASLPASARARRWPRVPFR
jgi:hypothetical protein